MQDRAMKTLVLFLIPLLLYVVPLPFTPLMEPDEARYSAVSSAMNATGDYVTPRLKGVVYFEKPPLSYWATAVFFRIFGENEFSSRLFAALCAWGCILLVYRMGLFFHDARTGLYAAAVLSTFLYHAAIGRINILDMPLAFLVCLSIWSGFRYFSSVERRKARLYLLYLFSALAFLAKGLIGIVFPLGVIVIWLAVSRRWREIPGLFSPIGIMVFSVVSLPWVILVQRENPDFFRFFFIQEHFLRYATRIHQHFEPFYFYLPIILLGTLPWCAFLPEALRGVRKGKNGLFGSVEMRFLLTWLGLILLFFSLSSSKLVPYVAPLFPPLALFFGHLFRLYEEEREAFGSEKAVSLPYRMAVMLQTLLLASLLLAPLFPHKYQMAWDNWWPWISFPLLMLLLTLFLPDLIRKRTGQGRLPTFYLLFALFLVSVTLPAARYMTPYKSALPLSLAIQKNIPFGATIYQYGMSLYGIDFYTGMRTPIVDDIGEMRYGSEQLPRVEKERYFLTSDSFFRLVRENDGIYCATKRGECLERLKKEVPGLQVLWHNDAYYLVRLKRS
ncbi:MAG: glycosyltransferase family 39 protein [Proteobacteria bacterium]|nr:glycosyltransferase family 39 protein [Pseudomonadota bacterium]